MGYHEFKILNSLRLEMFGVEYSGYHNVQLNMG